MLSDLPLYERWATLGLIASTTVGLATGARDVILFGRRSHVSFGRFIGDQPI